MNPSVALPAAVLAILPILCCPATRQPLREATADELTRLGQPAALVRADGQVAYPVTDGIPVLLADAAILLH